MPPVAKFGDDDIAAPPRTRHFGRGDQLDGFGVQMTRSGLLNKIRVLASLSTTSFIQLHVGQDTAYPSPMKQLLNKED